MIAPAVAPSGLPVTAIQCEPCSGGFCVRISVCCADAEAVRSVRSRVAIRLITGIRSPDECRHGGRPPVKRNPPRLHYLMEVQKERKTMLKQSRCLMYFALTVTTMSLYGQEPADAVEQRVLSTATRSVKGR